MFIKSIINQILLNFGYDLMTKRIEGLKTNHYQYVILYTYS